METNRQKYFITCTLPKKSRTFRPAASKKAFCLQSHTGALNSLFDLNFFIISRQKNFKISKNQTPSAPPRENPFF
jgi:hypothetical protein